MGWVTHDFARRLQDFPKVFQVSETAVEMAAGLADFAQRSAAMAEVLGRLRRDGTIKGWRDEPYPVGTDFYAPPLLQMERAAVPLFGVRAYGVHLNGFTGDGPELKLWVAKRSRTKQTAPGKLDHLVAGGQPLGLGLMDNLVKECGEEAGMAPALARTARPAGFVSYVTERVEGLRNDICFVYDIALPADFKPVNERRRDRGILSLADRRGAGAAERHRRFQVQRRPGEHRFPGAPRLSLARRSRAMSISSRACGSSG